jgi:hypothetical protein
MRLVVLRRVFDVVVMNEAATVNVSSLRYARLHPSRKSSGSEGRVMDCDRRSSVAVYVYRQGETGVRSRRVAIRSGGQHASESQAIWKR